MSVLADGQTAHAEPGDTLVQRKRVFRSWIFSYEIYIIVGVASFLRLYGLNTTEFDGDQADIFHMAHDAVIHGHLVATSNVASIGIYNPPGIIYALMIPAAFSANPIGGAIETAILAILGVFLTYWFTRRYYGRVAATIASGLSAATSVSLFYSRFMWNQNLLLGFIPLFLIVLYRGVVDRKPGWLFPAIFLYGLLFEWHGSSLLLAAPLVVAVLLAPKTVRWRDIVLGVLSLIVLYAPYILWLISTHFTVLSLLLQFGSVPSVVDNQSWLFYVHFISPYDLPFTNRLALLYSRQDFFNWLVPAMTYLVIAAAVFSLLLVLFLRTKRTESNVSRVLNRWWKYILDLRESPYRCGLLVLLVWQAVPLLVLIKHSLSLYPHYFIILMPGPFILIGLLVANVAGWFHTRGGVYRLANIALCIFVSLVVLFQGIAGAAGVLDTIRGNFDDHQMSYPYYYTDLNSLQNALAKADQLAQQYHAGRLIMVGDHSTRSAFRYFTDQLRISSTVVDDTCLLLPGPSTGRAVMLVPPYESVIDSFFASSYIHTIRSEASNRLGGAPFRLYVVDPLPEAMPQTTLSSNIQLVNAQTQLLQNGPFAAVRWNVLQSAPASDRTTYMYQFTYTGSEQGSQLPQQLCTVTNVHAGEQIVTLLPNGNVQKPLSVQVEWASTTPHSITLKHIPLAPAFDTFQQDVTPFKLLKTSEGYPTIPIRLNAS